MTDPKMTDLIAKHETALRNAAISEACDVVLKHIRKGGRREVRAALDLVFEDLRGLKR